jgi:hypothetical protein
MMCNNQQKKQMIFFTIRQVSQFYGLYVTVNSYTNIFNIVMISAVFKFFRPLDETINEAPKLKKIHNQNTIQFT